MKENVFKKLEDTMRISNSSSYWCEKDHKNSFIIPFFELNENKLKQLGEPRNLFPTNAMGQPKKSSVNVFRS
jgi:hypothetical protein